MPDRIKVVEDILSLNDKIALQNRILFDHARVFSINLMASPGAGKTSLIEHTVRGLLNKYKIGMINGDIATSLDADRAAAVGAVAVQVNTGGECHLDAIMLQQGLNKIPIDELDLLLVENVCNLVCPAGFRLGTHLSVLIASTPEGDDKPYKYPGMYRGVQALVINKIDLIPYTQFRSDFFRQGVEILNPGLVTIALSCRTGEGIDYWLEWI